MTSTLAQAKAKTAPASTTEEVADPQSGQPLVTRAPPSSQVHVEQKDWVELRDLAAQEAMAGWAMWMFIAAAATLLVTTLGTILIWRQVIFTRKAVEETAAGTAAIREANAITREIGEAQARSYLSAKGVLFSVDAGGVPHVSMSVLNSGQSPARNFRWAFQVEISNTVDNWRWESQPAEPGGGRDFPAQQLEFAELGILDGHPLPQEQLSDLLLDPLCRVSLNVQTSWIDVFGVESQETWRFQGLHRLGVENNMELFPDIPAVMHPAPAIV